MIVVRGTAIISLQEWEQGINVCIRHFWMIFLRGNDVVVWGNHDSSTFCVVDSFVNCLVITTCTWFRWRSWNLPSDGLPIFQPRFWWLEDGEIVNWQGTNQIAWFFFSRDLTVDQSAIWRSLQPYWRPLVVRVSLRAHISVPLTLSRIISHELIFDPPWSFISLSWWERMFWWRCSRASLWAFNEEIRASSFFVWASSFANASVLVDLFVAILLGNKRLKNLWRMS